MSITSLPGGVLILVNCKAVALTLGLVSDTSG